MIVALAVAVAVVAVPSFALVAGAGAGPSVERSAGARSAGAPSAGARSAGARSAGAPSAGASTAGVPPAGGRISGAPAWPPVTRSADVAALVAEVDLDRMLGELRRLSGEAPLCVDGQCTTVRHRVTGSPGAAQAVDYAAATGAALGYTVKVEDWARGGTGDRNVELRRTGVLSPTEEVYFIAHVDSVDGPGADDNGSGTVEGLELARIFADATFARTVVVLFLTGEEQGTLGADAYLARRSPADFDRVVALINADMVGYDGNGDRVMEIYHNNEPPSMAVASVMYDAVSAYGLNLVPRANPGCG
jgi:hypothetical protein